MRFILTIVFCILISVSAAFAQGEKEQVAKEKEPATKLD